MDIVIYKQGYFQFPLQENRYPQTLRMGVAACLTFQRLMFKKRHCKKSRFIKPLRLSSKQCAQ